MTAWEILTAGSTLPSGTAWQHLNAQGGGGGGPVTLQIFDSMECELMADVEAELIFEELTAELAVDELAAELEQDIGAELE